MRITYLRSGSIQVDGMGKNAKGIVLHSWQCGEQHRTSEVKTLVRGYHPVAVEQRKKCRGIAEIDEQSVMLYSQRLGRWFIFARANRSARLVHRGVQMTSAPTLLEGLWAPFQVRPAAVFWLKSAVFIFTRC